MIVIGLTGAAGSGKSTIAQHLVCEHDFQAIAFADPLWQMLETLGVDIERVAVDREYKDAVELPDIGCTPRKLIQTLGTEWGRQMIHPDLWVILARRQIAVHERLHGPIERLVFTDVRFANEGTLVHEMGGLVWYVHRRDAPRIRTHDSEHMGGVMPDIGIPNDRTVAELTHFVDRALAAQIEAIAERESEAAQ